jgi:hypothetical protein
VDVPELEVSMNAGRELDALVAEHITHFRRQDECETFAAGRCNGTKITYCGACGKTGHGSCFGRIYAPGGEVQIQCEERGCSVPYYSTDIAAAWIVLEEVRKRGFAVTISTWDTSREWRAEFDGITTDRLAHGCVFAKTAPEAICVAALKALGVEVPA